MRLHVLLADDHRLFRTALRGLLAIEPGIVVVGEADNGEQVVESVARIAPDLVCMDVNMPRLNGIETTRQLMANGATARVIGLSAYPDRRYVEEMLAAGAWGYVTKGESNEHLLPALRAVANGRKHFSPSVAAFGNDGRNDCGDDSPASLLTVREIDIMKLFSIGHTGVEIARRLDVCPSSIDAHRRNIMRKLNLYTMDELGAYVNRHVQPAAERPR